MDIPVPSICFSAYSFSSFLYEKKKERKREGNIFSFDLCCTDQYKYNDLFWFCLDQEAEKLICFYV